MTAFERAVVRAFIARTTLGDSSPEYESALQDMAMLRAGRQRMTAERAVRGVRCTRCGQPGHYRPTCPEPDAEAANYEQLLVTE